MGEVTDRIKPVILDQNGLDEFEQNNPGSERIDIYDRQLAELSKIQGNEVNDIPDKHIYYPWRKIILRCIDEPHLFILRTNRNKNLIKPEEQKMLADSVIGVAGMSVGAGIAIGAVYSGISNRIKIADYDLVDTSNLNRLRESLLTVGSPKVSLAAQHIYEINPFAEVEVFSDGINEQNINHFLDDPKLSVVVDEIDDFKMKVRLRIEARKSKVPLIMFTSLGDNILVDVERYDIEESLPIFHDLLQGVSEEILQSPTLSQADIKRYSVQLVGQEYIPTRALQSVAEMGKTLVGRPQLYGTIAADGGLATFVIRKLILEGSPNSGRYFVKFNDLFKIENDDLSHSAERNEILSRLFNND